MAVNINEWKYKQCGMPHTTPPQSCWKEVLFFVYQCVHCGSTFSGSHTSAVPAEQWKLFSLHQTSKPSILLGVWKMSWNTVNISTRCFQCFQGTTCLIQSAREVTWASDSPQWHAPTHTSDNVSTGWRRHTHTHAHTRWNTLSLIYGYLCVFGVKTEFWQTAKCLTGK